MFSGLFASAVLLAPGADPAPLTPSAPLTPEARRDALARYGVAVWQAKRERLLTAAKGFELAAKLDPDATAPLRELIGIYSQIGREPDAIRVARQVLEKDPQDADTAHTLARLLFDAGELRDAATIARLAAESPILAAHPEKAVAVYRDLATITDAAGDHDGAADALRKALALLIDQRKLLLRTTPARDIDSQTADTHERLGKVFVKQRKFDLAAEAFTSAAKLYADPTRADEPGAAVRLDWNLAAVHAARGATDQALLHLDAFLKLRPQSVDPYDRLVQILRQAGRNDTATVLRGYMERDPKNLPLQAIYAAEVARDPTTRDTGDALLTEAIGTRNDPALIRILLRSHVDTGRAGRILAELDRAYAVIKETDPDKADQRALTAGRVAAIADLLRAESAWALATLRVAAEDLRGGVRHEYRTWHFTGALAARYGQLELAAGQYRQAVRNGLKDVEADAYSGLIDVLWRLRRPAEVATVCRDGLRIAEQTAPVFFHFHLALAQAELGDAPEAIAAADKAILQSGDAARVEARVCKVRVLTILGRWDAAITFGNKLLEEFNTQADRNRVRYALASAYYGAKKYTEWEAELRAILDTDPDHTGACNDLGYHLADQGRNLDEAERLIRHAIAVDRQDRRKAGDLERDNASYLDSLGWVLFRKGKLTEARDRLEQATTLPDGSSHGEIWDHLGDVYFRLGEKAKAQAAWEKAVTLYAAEPAPQRRGRPDEVKRKLRLVP